MGAVLDALEEQVVLLSLLHEMAAERVTWPCASAQRPTRSRCARASLVASAYGPGATSLLGALGPTRMDYPGTMAAVRAVARYLSKVVEA